MPLPIKGTALKNEAKRFVIRHLKKQTPSTS